MFTQALIIEMPYDLFWYGETDIFYSYLDAYVKKQKNKYEEQVEMINFQCWLAGFYIDYALACNPAMGKKQKYLEKPVDIKGKEEKKELTPEEKEAQMMLSFNQFKAYVDLYNKQYFNNGNG